MVESSSRAVISEDFSSMSKIPPEIVDARLEGGDDVERKVGHGGESLLMNTVSIVAKYTLFHGLFV